MRDFPQRGLFLLCTLGLTLLAGCISPLPSYQKVDSGSPAFQAAVATETTRLEATGLSARQAGRTANENVAAQFIAAEAKRRKDLVAPLLSAIHSMEHTEGCWAYSLTTTTHKDQAVTVEIGTFDPSQPEDKQWTLVRSNGKVPDEKAQAAYRKERKEEEEKYADKNDAKAAGEGKGKDPDSWLVKEALDDNFEITTPEPGLTTFVFDHAERGVPLLASMGPAKITFVLENATATLRHVDLAVGTISAMIGAVKLDHLNVGLDFTVVEPAVAPMVGRLTVNYNARVLLFSSGEVTEDRVYSGYHRVDCVDDRFQVKFGPLEELDHAVPKQ